MTEAGFAELIAQACRKTLAHKLGEATLYFAAPPDIVLDDIARNVAQSVLTAIQIVEVENCCPVCNRPIGPAFVKVRT